MSSDEPKLDRIFERAREIRDREARSAFLDSACGEDGALRDRVEALLRASEKAGDFLEGEAAGLSLMDEDEFVPEDSATRLGSSPMTEGPGTRIGRYKLLKAIGEGGFGVVYVAEQKTPVRRRVALKIIKPGMDTRQVVARFEAERQALALMDHPNIAKVLDGGATDTGRPYFVMELVKGVPITRYCDEAALTLRARLDLFVPVCRAIQHAHQKGVIHRDVKPSNVMVSLQDGVPVPKVIDFGIAKATQQELTEKTLITQFSQFMGTPAYMSPEQAETSGLDIDTRTDVYSLGVLLYELLTGSTPFDTKELIQSGLEEMRKTIREREPVKPSTRLRKATSDHSFHSLATNHSPLATDLDWIVMKCLEKDRTRRYETASGLALDIGRFLRNEPVEAVAPSPVYLLSRFARKHRAALATAAGIAFILVAGSVFSMRQAFLATKAKEDLQTQLTETRKAREAESAAKDSAIKSAREADRQRRLTENALERMRIQKAEEHFQTDQAALGISELARVLRDNPTNHVAAARLSSALLHRAYTLPISRPMRHEQQIVSARFSRDGRRIVTASDDGTARVWDAGAGEAITGPLSHDGAVFHAQFTPDGRRVVTGSMDGTVRTWDATTGEALGDPLPLGEMLPDPRRQFSPDGRLLISQVSFDTIQIWDLRTRTLLGDSIRHAGGLIYAVFSPSGRRLAIVSSAGTTGPSARVWDVENQRPLGEPFNSERWNLALQFVLFSPDGRLIAVASGDSLEIWNPETGRLSGEPLRHESIVWTARFSPDGQRIVTTAARHAQLARIWDLRTRRPIGEPLRHQPTLRSAEFSPEGQRIVTSSTDRTARVWDAFSGSPLTEPFHHGAGLTSARFSPDGQRVVTVSSDFTVQVWDVRVGRPWGVRLRHRKNVTAARFGPDGRIVATGSLDESAQLWDARTGQRLTTPLVSESPVHSVQFSPDGRWVVMSSEQLARIWDTRTGAAIGEALKHNGIVGSSHFSPDGSRIVTASQDWTARIWDARTGAPLSAPLQHEGQVNSARFSPDGQRVLTASHDGTAQLWDVATGERVGAPLQHERLVGSAEFSPDGSRIVTASDDGTARIWDARTGAPLSAPLHHEHEVNSACFSPDGQRVLTASDDGTAQLWDVATGERVGAPLRHGENLRSARFSPDGTRLFNLGDLMVQVWDARTGLPLTEKFRYQSTVSSTQFGPDGRRNGGWSAQFSPDGRRLLTVSSADARLWDLPASAAAPVPDWFAGWAEVVGGRRFGPQLPMETVPVEELFELRRKTMEQRITDDYSRLARWRITDRENQTISPFSFVTRNDYVRRRIEEDTIESLREALFMAPTNGVALARLAIRTLEQGPAPDSGIHKEARFYADQAVRWTPDSEDGWIALAEIQLADEQFESAGNSANRALELQPENVTAWRLTARILEKRRDFQAAVEAYGRALDRARVSDPRQYKEILLARAGLLRILERHEQAVSDIHRAYDIAPRPPETDPRLVDLSVFYNCGLKYSTLNYPAGVSIGRFGPWPGNDLSELPTGIQTLAGVEFDVRGVIQLTNRRGLENFPSSVEGIPIDRTCRRAHFLHGVEARGFDPLDTEIAKLVFHYSDGTPRERPIVLGRDVLEWWVDFPTRTEIPDPTYRVAWTGSNPLLRAASGRKIQLFITTWENPLPEKQIASLDFVATHPGGNSCPFLLAVTVE